MSTKTDALITKVIENEYVLKISVQQHISCSLF